MGIPTPWPHKRPKAGCLSESLQPKSKSPSAVTIEATLIRPRSLRQSSVDPPCLDSRFSRTPSHLLPQHSPMATMESLQTHFYLLSDVSTLRSATMDTTQSIVLLVNGPTAVMTLVLPTAPHILSLCPYTLFEDWVQAILGRELNNCDPNDPQCTIILQLALVYQYFFYNIDDDGNLDLFRLFVEHLLGVALTLEDHDPAEFALAQVVNWAHDILPPNVFWDLPHVEVPSAGSSNVSTAFTRTPTPTNEHAASDLAHEAQSIDTDVGATPLGTANTAEAPETYACTGSDSPPATGAITTELASMLGLLSVNPTTSPTDAPRSRSASVAESVASSFVVVAVPAGASEEMEDGYGSDDSEE
ncbi:hypothetical protein C8Q76DRAFT_802476 [Earliella scabrosa]|nr:hypothetical protein C8Q76DRAFT_802476 [Earliella scabrosa]